MIRGSSVAAQLGAVVKVSAAVLSSKQRSKLCATEYWFAAHYAVLDGCPPCVKQGTKQTPPPGHDTTLCCAGSGGTTTPPGGTMRVHPTTARLPGAPTSPGAPATGTAPPATSTTLRPATAASSAVSDCWAQGEAVPNAGEGLPRVRLPGRLGCICCFMPSRSLTVPSWRISIVRSLAPPPSACLPRL